MELGNMMFGNSRGLYSVPRDAFRAIFGDLLDVLEDENGYGIYFENDIFSMMPYWWGDCTCGAEAPDHDESCPDCWKNKKWLSDIAKCTCGANERYSELAKMRADFIGEHAKDCCRSEIVEIEKVRDYPPQISDDELKERLRPLYKIHGWDTKGKNWWHGWVLRCSCGKTERENKWWEENGHKENCQLVLPNFLYKPTGFEIQWYKYPFRDSYMNQNLKAGKFAEIIESCITSLGSDTNDS